MSRTHIVWFKRDLRVHDHAPLAAACAAGEPVLALFVFEPELWTGPGNSVRQLNFLRESLVELRDALGERGAQLVIRSGDVSAIFAQLHRDLGVAAIHSYREGRSGPEGKRNDAVRRWALRAGVSMREQASGSLLRQADTPSDWRARWQAHMSAPRRLAPEFIYAAAARSEAIDGIGAFQIDNSEEGRAPPGGRTHAVRLLRRAFVSGDAHTFRDVMRALKLHILMGTISVREAVQAALRAKRIGAPGESVTYAETLIDRLRDECERQQRLEMRAAARPLGQIPVSSIETPLTRRPVMSSSLRARHRTPLARRDDQLSFDFPGPKAPPRRVS